MILNTSSSSQADQPHLLPHFKKNLRHYPEIHKAMNYILMGQTLKPRRIQLA